VSSRSVVEMGAEILANGQYQIEAARSPLEVLVDRLDAVMLSMTEVMRLQLECIDKLNAPRVRRVVRDETGAIVALVEQLAPLQQERDGTIGPLL
jgi:hypothetical protein